MTRRLRHVPEPGTLVEVTCRVIQGRMLLRPNRFLNEMVVGTLARGKRRYGVRICAVAFLSNHAHLLLDVDDAKQLADFMGFVSSKIAREVGRRVRWREKFWGKRYTAIVVSTEVEAQIARLRYVLAHGVKEHLVTRCADWPGVHAAGALTTGKALAGYWFDRTAEYRARLRGQDISPYAHAKRESLSFDPLPCWKHFDRNTYQTRVAEIVASIEANAAAVRNAHGNASRAVTVTGRRHPQRPLHRLKRSPAPAFHAATKRARFALMETYRWFEIAYREATKGLKAGHRTVPFPKGCFPPSLPFVVTD